MKVVILTQYFPPEVGAPQNRLYELAIRLMKMGAEITIVTAMPNYPKMEIHEGYRGKWYVREEMSGMMVHRCWIFVSRSKGIIRRLLNYYSFAFSSLWIGLIKLKKHDILLVESPPLFLGKTAFLLSRFKGAKMVLNVSDLWPESAEKLGLVTNRLFLKMAYQLEKFLYRKSWLITGQTQGIVKDITRRFPARRVYWLPNGVDVNFFNAEDGDNAKWRSKMGFAKDDFILLYGGIIGHAQGLEVILKAANRLKDIPAIRFILLGSGPEKEKLLALNTELKLSNVIFLEPVSKNEMPHIVCGSDASIIPLRKLDLFLGAIPSKIFESLAMKKPLILGVDGEAKALFIDEGKAGLFFEPENDEDLARQIKILFENSGLRKQFGENGLRYVTEKFERDKTAVAFWKVLNENNLSQFQAGIMKLEGGCK
jgi:glycosyltransferase involved in cell wall biosynthesis